MDLDFVRRQSDEWLMNYFIRNNINDFGRWYEHIVPFAMSELKQFECGRSTVIFREEYEDALRVKQQLYAIKELLDNEHICYLEEVLIQRRRDKDQGIYRPKLFDEIFEIWRTVCFPNGKSQLKIVDPVLLGGELKAMRMERHIPAKHVAGLVGIAEQTLYCYEEGSRTIRVDTFYQFCQIYKSDPGEILQKTAL